MRNPRVLLLVGWVMLGGSVGAGCSKDLTFIDTEETDTADTDYVTSRVHAPEVGWRARVKVRDPNAHTR